MSMQGVLREREGALYVVYETTKDSEPQRVRMWWLVQQTRGNQYSANRPEAGDKATANGDSHSWGCYREGCGSTGSVSFPGNQQAAFVETEDVPQPKVRKGIEIRWYQGRWQKYTKREGWIST